MMRTIENMLGSLSVKRDLPLLKCSKRSSIDENANSNSRPSSTNRTGYNDKKICSSAFPARLALQVDGLEKTLS